MCDSAYQDGFDIENAVILIPHIDEGDGGIVIWHAYEDDSFAFSVRLMNRALDKIAKRSLT